MYCCGTCTVVHKIGKEMKGEGMKWKYKGGGGVMQVR